MPDDSANRRLKIEAPDASRVEWSVYIPLPRGKGHHDADVELHLEFPENIYAPHDGWDNLQILARLSSPDEDAAPSAPVTFDGLRRSALGVARRMKLLRESIPRAALGHALDPMPAAAPLARDLDHLLDQAIALLAQARRALVAAQPTDSPELTRERALADEFLSGQLLDLLTSAEETCARMELEGGPAVPGTQAAAQPLRARISGALAQELSERESKGELLPDAGDPEGLALFLDRAAQLKKHFQEVLFLEPESKMIDQALRNWVGAYGAALAFLIYFGLQTLQSSAAAGLSIGTLMTVGAIGYALKDRAKELTRQWLAGKLSHLYAARILTLREPFKFDRTRNAVLRARESLEQARVARPDPLNPGTGAVQRVVTMHYRQRARVSALKGPTGSVFERVKIIFRYDLSPILSRLDDSVKRVPVPGPGGRGVLFAEAPRLYRVPLSLTVATRVGIERRDAEIVLSRRGIARIVPLGSPPAAAPREAPALPGLDGSLGNPVAQA